MKSRLTFFTVLLALALFAAACGAQEATTEPGVTTGISTDTVDNSTATEGIDEALMTPTGVAESGTPTQSTGETGTTPTVSADGGTPSQGADGTAVIPQTGLGDAGLPDDVDEIVRILIETGVTVEAGGEVTQDFVPVPGQSILINGEEVQIFTYPSAEKLEAQAAQLLRQGDPEDEPQFYKLGNMLVHYAGRDPLVRDLLEDVLGARAGGQ